MRSRDSASAGVCGSVLEMFDTRLVGTVLVILMTIGDEGELIAFRVVAFGLVTTWGRLRLRIGVGSFCDAGSDGGGGSGSNSEVSMDGRAELFSDGA